MPLVVWGRLTRRINRLPQSASKEWIASNRRLSLTILTLSVLGLITIRFTWLANRDSLGHLDSDALFRDIIDGLLGTVFVSAIISTVLWWISPPTDVIPSGFQIFPREISGRLETSARDTEEWEYSGHTGRYIRSRILPILDRAATQGNKRIRLRAVITDPRDQAACDYYVAYRRQARSTEFFDDDWSLETIRVELLATIIAIIRLANLNRNIEADIGLRKTISLIRIDRSSDRVITTLEDPQEPAFDYPKGSRFYDYMRRQCAMDWDQCDHLDLSSLNSNCNWEDVSGVHARLSLILRTDFFDRDIVSKALSIFKAGRSPYA